MDTILLIFSGFVVCAWVLTSAFSLEVIRMLEANVAQRRAADGRMHLIAPSGWQATAI